MIYTLHFEIISLESKVGEGFLVLVAQKHVSSVFLFQIAENIFLVLLLFLITLFIILLLLLFIYFGFRYQRVVVEMAMLLKVLLDVIWSQRTKKLHS